MLSMTLRGDIVAMVIVLISLVLGGTSVVPKAEESSKTHELYSAHSAGWEDALCRAVGCPNNSELECATVSGTLQVVVMFLGKKVVIYEEEYTITCTQGWV